ncbi:MAG: cohesin domain-containing protein [Phycisphaerae bacterium]|nr:cohesin domain-containing protein [Phycisphaerae bacterium]
MLSTAASPRCALLFALAAVAMTFTGQPAWADPRADGDTNYHTAALIGQFEPTFAKWYERVSARGEEPAYAPGGERGPRRKVGWDVVGPQVAQAQDMDVPMPGRLFIVAEFAMEDKADFNLSRLYSVGGLYPVVQKQGKWEALRVDAGGFHISQRIGDRELTPFRQFVYKGALGDKSIRVTGSGLPVQPGKMRLNITSAVANDSTAHFPSTAKVYVYFCPNFAAGGGGKEAGGDAVRADPPPRDDKDQRPCELLVNSVSRPSGAVARVPILLTNADRLGDLNLTITYPANLLELTGVAKGTILGKSLFDANAGTPGQARIGLASDAGLTGNAFLCYLDFRVTGPAGKKAAITAKVKSASRVGDSPVEKLAIRVTDGQVVIEGLCGDGDGDGQITSNDALMALQMSTGRRPVDLVLDINGDGEVTALDARWLTQIAVGVRPEGYTGPMPGQPATTAPPATPPGPPIDAAKAQADYVAALDEMTELLDATEVETPDEIRQAQRLLRQAEKAFDVTKTTEGYRACELATDRLNALVMKVAIESPASVKQAQQKLWAAAAKLEQARRAGPR